MSTPTHTYSVPIKPPNGPIMWIQVVAWSLDQALRMALAQVSGGQAAGPIKKLD
jgi:hypothetical protein